MTISARTLTVAAAALLCASVLANAVLALPSATEFFPLFFFIHLALIGLGIWAILRIRRVKANWEEVFGAFRPTPRWLLATGAVVAAITLVSARNISFDFGTMPDGTQVHSKSWQMTDGRYWLSLNKQPALEISKAEYEKLQRESYTFFAVGWLIFSYVILIQWYYVGRREAVVANAA